MHSTLPSSLARFRQPSRATSKNGLFIALGTTAKRYFCWANAGLAMITTATVARIIFFIGFLHAFMPILKIVWFGRRIDRAVVAPSRSVFSNHARAYPVDQHSQDDDHADQGLLPVGIDLRQHEAVADDLEQDAADDGAERTADAARQIGAADDGGCDHVELIGRRHVRGRRTQPARDDDALESRGQRADHIDLDLDPDYRNAGQFGGFLVAAEREDVAAERRVMQYHGH